MLEEFIEHKKKLSEGHKTIAVPYYYQLKNFEKFLESKGYDLETFHASHVEEYMRKLKDTVSSLFLAAIREYVKFRTDSVSDSEFLRESRRHHSLMMIRSRKVKRTMEKKSLAQNELETLIRLIDNEDILAGIVLTFYFGWRPIEGVINVRDANIKLKHRYMIIEGAKTHDERIIVWAPELDKYVKHWLTVTEKLSNYKRPDEWITKRVRPYSHQLAGMGVIPENMHITAKTGRRTFRTRMLSLGNREWMIRFIQGWRIEIPDIYTDWTDPQLIEDLRYPMEQNHYMLNLLKEYNKEIVESEVG